MSWQTPGGGSGPPVNGSGPPVDDGSSPPVGSPSPNEDLGGLISQANYLLQTAQYDPQTPGRLSAEPGTSLSAAGTGLGGASSSSSTNAVRLEGGSGGPLPLRDETDSGSSVAAGNSSVADKSKRFNERVLSLYASDVVRESRSSQLNLSSQLLGRLLRMQPPVARLVVSMLAPQDRGYSLGYTNSAAKYTELATFPYEEKYLLECIDNEAIPVILTDLLEGCSVDLYHQGCMLCEIRDMSGASRHILMRPDTHSNICDSQGVVKTIHQGISSSEDRSSLESQVVMAAEGPICLDPSPVVGLVSHSTQHNRLRLNSQHLRRHVTDSYSHAGQAKRRRLTEAMPAPPELKIHDFIKNLNTKRLSGTNKRRILPTELLKHHQEQTAINLRTIEACRSGLVPPPSCVTGSLHLAAPNIRLALPSQIDVDKYATVVSRRSDSNDMTPQLIEEYILETAERSQPRVYHTRLTILQRLANEEYIGELYVERDFKETEEKGSTCRFQLGTRANALKYINQFTEIFTEEGRKCVKITHKVPGQQPRVTFTAELRARMAQQQAQQQPQPQAIIIQQQPNVVVSQQVSNVGVTHRKQATLLTTQAGINILKPVSGIGGTSGNSASIGTVSNAGITLQSQQHSLSAAVASGQIKVAAPAGASASGQASIVTASKISAGGGQLVQVQGAAPGGQQQIVQLASGQHILQPAAQQIVQAAVAASTSSAATAGTTGGGTQIIKTINGGQQIVQTITPQPGSQQAQIAVQQHPAIVSSQQLVGQHIVQGGQIVQASVAGTTSQQQQLVQAMSAAAAAGGSSSGIQAVVQQAQLGSSQTGGGQQQTIVQTLSSGQQIIHTLNAAPQQQQKLTVGQANLPQVIQQQSSQQQQQVHQIQLSQQAAQSIQQQKQASTTLSNATNINNGDSQQEAISAIVQSLMSEGAQFESQSEGATNTVRRVIGGQTPSQVSAQLLPTVPIPPTSLVGQRLTSGKTLTVHNLLSRVAHPPPPAAAAGSLVSPSAASTPSPPTTIKVTMSQLKAQLARPPSYSQTSPAPSPSTSPRTVGSVGIVPKQQRMTPGDLMSPPPPPPPTAVLMAGDGSASAAGSSLQALLADEKTATAGGTSLSVGGTAVVSVSSTIASSLLERLVSGGVHTQGGGGGTHLVSSSAAPNISVVAAASSGLMSGGGGGSNLNPLATQLPCVPLQQVTSTGNVLSNNSGTTTTVVVSHGPSSAGSIMTTPAGESNEITLAALLSNPIKAGLAQQQQQQVVSSLAAGTMVSVSSSPNSKISPLLQQLQQPVQSVHHRMYQQSGVTNVVAGGSSSSPRGQLPPPSPRGALTPSPRPLLSQQGLSPRAAGGGNNSPQRASVNNAATLPQHLIQQVRLTSVPVNTTTNTHSILSAQLSQPPKSSGQSSISLGSSVSNNGGLTLLQNSSNSSGGGLVITGQGLVSSHHPNSGQHQPQHLIQLATQQPSSHLQQQQQQGQQILSNSTGQSSIQLVTSSPSTSSVASTTPSVVSVSLQDLVNQVNQQQQQQHASVNGSVSGGATVSTSNSGLVTLGQVQLVGNQSIPVQLSIPGHSHPITFSVTLPEGQQQQQQSILVSGVGGNNTGNASAGGGLAIAGLGKSNAMTINTLGKVVNGPGGHHQTGNNNTANSTNLVLTHQGGQPTTIHLTPQQLGMVNAAASGQQFTTIKQAGAGNSGGMAVRTSGSGNLMVRSAGMAGGNAGGGSLLVQMGGSSSGGNATSGSQQLQTGAGGTTISNLTNITLQQQSTSQQQQPIQIVRSLPQLNQQQQLNCGTNILQSHLSHLPIGGSGPNKQVALPLQSQQSQQQPPQLVNNPSPKGGPPTPQTPGGLIPPSPGSVTSPSPRESPSPLFVQLHNHADSPHHLLLTSSGPAAAAVAGQKVGSGAAHHHLNAQGQILNAHQSVTGAQSHQIKIRQRKQSLK